MKNDLPIANIIGLEITWSIIPGYRLKPITIIG
jgi:hypothetical protein